MRLSSFLRSSRFRQAMTVPLAACLFGGLALITTTPSGARSIAPRPRPKLSAAALQMRKGLRPGYTSSTVTLADTAVAISGRSRSPTRRSGCPRRRIQQNDWNTVAKASISGRGRVPQAPVEILPVNPLDAAGAQQSMPGSRRASHLWCSTLGH